MMEICSRGAEDGGQGWTLARRLRRLSRRAAPGVACLIVLAGGRAYATHGCPQLPEIAPNAVALGTLSETDCTIAELGIDSIDETFVDLYLVTIPTNGLLSVRLESTEFDAFLYLSNVPLTVFLGLDDDGAGGDDALIPDTVVLPGTYVILVNSFFVGLGDYTLTTTFDASGDNPCLETVDIGSDESVDGGLAAQDCTLDELGLLEEAISVDLYRVEIPDGGLLSVSLESPDFDTVIQIFDSSLAGFIAGDGEDGGGGNDSMVSPTVLFPGSYIILVSSFELGETGGYTITTSLDPSVDNPCLDVVDYPGTSVAGELSAQDCRLSELFPSSDESPVDVFRFSVETGGPWRALLQSGAFDAFIGIYDASLSAPIIEDDDGGVGLNAHTPPVILLPGDYLILANAIDEGAEGPYILTVPEPSGALLQLVAFGTLVALARRRASPRASVA